MRRLRQHAVACLSAPWMQPVSGALARWYGGLATSLLYHRVVAGPADPAVTRCRGFRPNLSLSVAEDRFDEQMRELRDRYRAVPLPDAVDELVRGELAPGTVTVTFDDGYRDNLRVALPIAERHGIPITIYITTGLIDRRALLWWEELEQIVNRVARLAFQWGGQDHVFDLHDATQRSRAFHRIALLFKSANQADQQALMERLRDASGILLRYDDDILDWSEVQQLDRHPLVTIAAHTVTHPVLRNLDPAAVRDEMRQSRLRLETMLGRPVPMFAYPFGGPAEAGEREFELCEAEGFDFAVTTRTGHWHPGHRDHRFALPRIMVEYWDTLEDFRFKLSGLDAFLRQRGRRFVTA